MADANTGFLSDANGSSRVVFRSAARVTSWNSTPGANDVGDDGCSPKIMWNGIGLVPASSSNPVTVAALHAVLGMNWMMRLG